MPLDINDLTSFLSLLITLSVATERLVEIVKAPIPWLNNPKPAGLQEDVRKAVVQLMAVGAGIGTA